MVLNRHTPLLFASIFLFTILTGVNVKAGVQFADPGPAPILNATEYTRYLGRGSGSLTVQFAQKISASETIKFTSGVFAYPDTAYTRWLIRKQIYLAQQHPVNWDHAWPGANDYPVAIPPYLQPMWDTDDPTLNSAVRAGHCNRSGWCTFPYLHPGHYIFYGDYSTGFAFIGSEATVNPNVITPEGLPEVGSRDVLMHQITGGYLMATPSGYFANLPEEAPYQISPGLNVVMAHYTKKVK